MKRKLYTGLGALLVLIIGISVVMLTRTTDTETPVVIYRGDTEPTPRPGYKLVPHDDHYHEVPIESENDIDVDNHVQNETTPAEAPTYTPITMSNNPVKDLREYLETKGHWSAKWIPEFPPEDTEAARMAHNYLIMLNHAAAGNEYYDGPALIPARETRETLKHYKKIETPRAYDIYKLSWSILDEPIEFPEIFNIHGFDKAAFDKKRAERKAREENNR